MKHPKPDRPAARTPPLLGWMRQRLQHLRKNEDGTASIEFLVAIPLIMTLFMASIESGVLMTRYILLEKSVDMVMRELRLGIYPTPSPELMKADICERAIIMPDCAESITIEMNPINTATWTMPAVPTSCVDREIAMQPTLDFNPGASHQIVLVRVCVTQDAIFPTSGIGLALPKDGKGGYALVASSAFVNEPRLEP